MNINQARPSQDTGRQISAEQMAAALRVLQHCQVRTAPPAQVVPAQGLDGHQDARHGAEAGGP